MIVRALGDGKAYWLDPTRPEQQGDLAHLYQPDYGMALVLDNASSTLVKTGTQAKALRAIRSSYDLRGKPGRRSLLQQHHLARPALHAHLRM